MYESVAPNSYTLEREYLVGEFTYNPRLFISDCLK